MPGMAVPRPMQGIELRMNKDGKWEAVQDTRWKAKTGRKMARRKRPSGEEGSKTDKPAAEKEDPDRARRIRQLQEEAERLRRQLNKLKER